MSDSYDKLKDQIDYVSEGSGLGSLSESLFNTLTGINHRGVGNPVPYNQDNQGLTFFTRPRLNLSYNNLMVDRRLAVLSGRINNVPHYGAVIRRWLDPELAKAMELNESNILVDPKMPFIPLLTNNLISLSGWPDPVTEYYNAPEGLAKETWSMADGVDTIYSGFDLNATFRNITGDPISMMFYVWQIYMSLVYQGRIHPYPDSEMLREIDYQTRIYRLVLDPTRRFITKIAACGAAFPTSSNLGQAFDFSADTPFEQSRASQIQIPLRAIGAMYQDPILMQEFNDLVYMFNEDMQPGKRESRMVQISPLRSPNAPSSEETLHELNYYGYPRINMKTNELEWWINKEVLAERRNRNKAIVEARGRNPTF